MLNTFIPAFSALCVRLEDLDVASNAAVIGETLLGGRLDARQDPLWKKLRI